MKKMKKNEFKLRDSDTNNYPWYYGYVNLYGDYYIIRVSKSGSVQYYFSPPRSKITYFEAWDDRNRIKYNYSFMF